MKNIKILNQFEENDRVYIIAESISKGCKCPKCGVISNAKHSKYTRKLFSGSLNGVSKEITLIVRKYICKTKECSQKIFTKRLPFATVYSRFTTNIIELIKMLALSTSAKSPVPGTGDSVEIILHWNRVFRVITINLENL